jgi:hypothetical protein
MRIGVNRARESCAVSAIVKHPLRQEPLDALDPRPWFTAASEDGQRSGTAPAYQTRSALSAAATTIERITQKLRLPRLDSAPAADSERSFQQREASAA